MKMTNLLTSFALGLAVLSGAPVCQAVSLQRADVAADPAWLVHVDLDRLRSTTVGQYIVTEMEKPEAQAKLAAFQAMFKFDLRTQLHGLTLYGTGPSPEEGVLLVYADFDPDHLATLAKGANEYKGSEHNQHVIHSWIDTSKKKVAGSRPRTYAAAQGSRLLVFGQREASVARALDVLDLSSANLTASKTFPALDNISAFLQAAAQKLPVNGSDPNAAVFRLSKMIRFDIGEAQNQVKAHLQLTAQDPEVAKQIASIGQGLISLMKLQKDRPEAGKLADAISLTQDSNDVSLNISLTSSDAIELMKADAARKAKKSE